MSDVSSSLDFDISDALRQVDALERRLNEATQVTLRADASLVTAAIDAAIAAAQAEVTVQAEAAGVTSEVDAAIQAADETVEVQPDASRLTSAIDSAIDSADASIDVDTSGIAGDVTSALDAADTTVEADADASRVTGAIDSAVDQADDSVQVDGDASRVTGAIDSAVDAADTSVDIDADPSGLQSAARAGDALNTSLIASTASGVQLRSVLQLGGAAAAAAGLYQLVDAASQLEQAVGGTTAIFGEAEGAVVGFARNAAESTGLTEEAARSLTSRLGGLLQGFGFTQEGAAELSITLAQLGADLAATFGGSTSEAVEAIGAALRGETDPIERYGISLNAAAIETRALEDGLVASKSELDANSKATTALAIIMDQAGGAQGQFAREVGTTAGQLERARAEVGNMAAEVGATLQPVVNELVASARSDLIPALGDLGTSLGPALGDALLALLPAFGTVTDLLIAATPAVSAFATALGAIPAPVIAALGTFLAFRAAAGPLSSVLNLVAAGVGGALVPTNAIAGAMNTAGGSANTFRQGLSGIVGSINPATVALGAGAVAFSLWASEQQKARQVQREHEREVTDFASALSGSRNAVDGYVDALSQMVEAGDDVVISVGNLRGEMDLTDILGDAGLTVDQLSEAVRRGDREIDRLLETIEGGSENETVLLRNAVKSVTDTMQEGAQQSIEASVALDDYSRASADAAIRANTNAEGQVNYARALDQLKESEREAAQAAEEAAAQQDALASAVGGIDAEGQAREVTLLGGSMRALRDGVGNAGLDFIQFALAADAAGLSGDELDAVAAELGVTADDLSSGIDSAAGAVQDFASSASRGVPSLQDLAGNIDEFTTEGFRDDLREALDAVTNFQDNLRVLSEQSPALGAAGAILGPDFAAVLAEDARAGRTAVLDEISLLLPALEAEGVNVDSLYQNQLGPEWIATLQGLGLDMNGALDQNFNPVEVVTPSIASIEGAIEQGAPDIGAAMNDVGTGATAAFDTGFNPDAQARIHAVDQQVQEAQPGFIDLILALGTGGSSAFQGSFRPDANPGVDGATGTVAARQAEFFAALNIFADQGDVGFNSNFRPDPGPALAAASRAVANLSGGWFNQLSGFGSAGRTGFRGGISGMSSDAGSATDQAVNAVAIRRGSGRSAGFGVGSDMGAGVVSGLQSQMAAVRSLGASIVDNVATAMRAAAQISSPSRLFRDEVGIPIGEGVAAGIYEALPLIEGSATAAVDAAVAAAQSAADATTSVSVDPVAIAQATRDGGTSTLVTIGAGAVVIYAQGGATPAANRLAGEQAAQGFTEALAVRQVRATARLAGTRG